MSPLPKTGHRPPTPAIEAPSGGLERIVDLPGPTPAPPVFPERPDHRSTLAAEERDPTKQVETIQARLREITDHGPAFGPRKDSFLPFLVIRSAAGDTGRRPVPDYGLASPDILVAAGLEPRNAPLEPPFVTPALIPGSANTLYAHIWNLGLAPAFDVRVEFHWSLPGLPPPADGRQLVGVAWIDLGNRATRWVTWRRTGGEGSEYLTRGAHAVVRCPAPWRPKPGVGERLSVVVRAFDPLLDPAARNHFEPADDRHVARRDVRIAAQVPEADQAPHMAVAR